MFRYNDNKQAFITDVKLGTYRQLVEAAEACKAPADIEVTAAGGELLLVTQNVDDLHEKAGTRSLLHMHGELKSVI